MKYADVTVESVINMVPAPVQDYEGIK
jgi:hypothetical protein